MDKSPTSESHLYVTNEYDNKPETSIQDSSDLENDFEKDEIVQGSHESKSESDEDTEMKTNGDTQSNVNANEDGHTEPLAGDVDPATETAGPSPDTLSTEVAVPGASLEATESNLDDETEEGAPAKRLVPALSALAIGLAIGIVISGIGVIRTHSSQSSLASFLVKTDRCGASTTLPTGICFNSPVSVNYNPTNPLNQFLATPGTIKLSAAQARIGIFGNSNITLRIAGLNTSTIGNSAAFKSSTSGTITGTISMPYSQLTHTLQSGSNTGAKIFYVGANEIGTSNDISYQGKTIALEVTSKIALSKNELYLTPLTVTALGHTAPASSVFSNVSPVPVTIPKLPSGMRYSSLDTTKSQLVFNLAGSQVRFGSLFNAT